MLVTIITMISLALAISAVSVTITKSGIFGDLREWVDDKSDFYGDLVHCPYCMSHWLSFMAVAFYQPRLVVGPLALADYAVSAFVLVALASFSSGLIIRAFSGGTQETPGGE